MEDPSEKPARSLLRVRTGLSADHMRTATLSRIRDLAHRAAIVRTSVETGNHRLRLRAVSGAASADGLPLGRRMGGNPSFPDRRASLPRRRLAVPGSRAGSPAPHGVAGAVRTADRLSRESPLPTSVTSLVSPGNLPGTGTPACADRPLNVCCPDSIKSGKCRPGSIPNLAASAVVQYEK